MKGFLPATLGAPVKGWEGGELEIVRMQGQLPFTYHPHRPVTNHSFQETLKKRDRAYPDLFLLELSTRCVEKPVWTTR